MSDKINDGGPVFPHIDTDEPTAAGYTSKPGMTLRDYFAAKAMAVFMALPGREGTDLPDDARAAYEMADAMLAARNGGAA